VKCSAKLQERAFLTSKFINSWDDWVPQDRLRKLTDDNRELAANLKRDLVQPQPTRTSTKPASSSRRGKGQGSDLGSGRGSEERHSSVPAGGRGTKRGKDNDVEKVSP
jgi:mortality factor 4-like protein 1